MSIFFVLDSKFQTFCLNNNLKTISTITIREKYNDSNSKLRGNSVKMNVGGGFRIYAQTFPASYLQTGARSDPAAEAAGAY